MKALLAALFLAPLVTLNAEDSNIAWIVQWNGSSLPTGPWAAIGKPNAKLEDGTLHLSDDAKDDLGAFEAEWTGDLDGQEIIVDVAAAGWGTDLRGGLRWKA